MFPITTFLLSSHLLIHAAGGVPNVDLKNTCKNAATVNATVTQQDIDICVRDERDAHDQLVKEWAQFSGTSKGQCLHVSIAYLPSYIEMLTCLEMGRDAKKLPEETTPR